MMETGKEGKNMSREELSKARKDKIEKQIAAAVRILEKGVEPLEIADTFIHESFQILKEGVSQRYPNLSDEETHQKIRELLSLSDKFKTH
jgi:hypothetical protein